MATIDWPDNLPQIYLDENYAEAMAENVIRDPNDVGPATLRRRATHAPFPVAGNMVMTTEEWESLEAFIADVLLQGSLAFGIREQGIEEDEEWLVRLMAAPTRERMGLDWNVTLQLEVLP